MTPDQPSAEPGRRREWAMLAVVLAVATGLRTWRLDLNGLGNLYYGAAVRSMLAGGGHFFFGSFDPLGIVTVDKPPVALWLQALGAKLLGYNSWGVLLPQALMGVASVGLTYHLVRRAFGASAGLLAGLALAVTPICVAVDRDNLPDSALVLVLLLASWALTRASETGRAGFLLMATALVGVGFNVKMLAAFVVLPTFYLTYFLTSPTSWRARLGHLAAATGVLVAASLSWPIAVELTPKDRRPFVGGSRSNSALELAVGYNGIARIMGMGGPMGSPGGRPFPGGLPNATPPTTGGEDEAAPAFPPPITPGRGLPPFPPGGPFGGGMPGFGGTPGLLRFAGREMSGLITWLFPIAVLGTIAAASRSARARPIGREAVSLLLWGGWFGTHWVVFSFARGIFHDYYTTVMGPAVAAMFGIGTVALWGEARRGGWRAGLLPMAWLLTAAWQAKIVAPYPEWARWLVPAVLAGSVLGSLGLIGSRRLASRWPDIPWAGWGAALGLGAILVGPSAWSSTAMMVKGNSMFPTAGPGLLGRGPSGGMMMPPAMFDVDPESNRMLIAFLRANRHDEPILVASMASPTVAPIIVEGGEAVSLGGFMGMDPVLTRDQFAAKVEAGQVRFFLITPGPGGGGGMPPPPPGMPGPPPGMMGHSEITAWVREHGEEVPKNLWMPPEPDEAPEDQAPAPMAFFGRMRRMAQLYDCRPGLGRVVPTDR